MSPGKTRIASNLWIIPALALVLILVFLWFQGEPAPITGQRVFGDGDLIVRPAQSGDSHRISERQARDALSAHVFGDYSQPPRLLLFGFGRVTAHLMSEATPIVDRPAWIGVYQVPLSALFFSCPMYRQTPPPPKPHEDSFNIAIIIDRDRGTQAFWQGGADIGAYMKWGCATGHSQL
jgi:hypothetical protein